ncbi:hypothetical protein A4S05_06480 [Nostoc sp. KVJ20]|uniref:hypothetical protein n=1 Tax=unclassified Nostoc TaxID=2593658 RepID=UPI00083DA874|nr:hypothetical protein [Nostoc sp. KVJ20]ODG98980.1 hypothetical protein A4S05_06480 [Nostoc sp. KVJ20]
MKTNFRITKLMIFCIGAYILIPKIAVCTGVFSTASANTFATTSSSNTLIAHKVNSQDTQDTYIPPNYGGPDSQHGSGTR